jgi:hypothetical protein
VYHLGCATEIRERFFEGIVNVVILSQQSLGSFSVLLPHLRVLRVSVQGICQPPNGLDSGHVYRLEAALLAEFDQEALGGFAVVSARVRVRSAFVGS